MAEPRSAAPRAPRFAAAAAGQSATDAVAARRLAAALAPYRAEIAWAALVLLSFPVVAALAAGLGPEAMANGARLVGWQARLGIGGDGAAARWLAARPPLGGSAEVLYVWLHVPVTVGALGWACVRRPAVHRRLRTGFVVAHGATLACYLAFPVAPPWMLAAGGDLARGEAGLGGVAHLLQSPYAAMPSGHVLWAVVAAGAAWACLDGARWRPVVIAYPVLVALLTVATGNHHAADVAAGAAMGAAVVLAARP